MKKKDNKKYSKELTDRDKSILNYIEKYYILIRFICYANIENNRIYSTIQGDL